MRAMRGAGPAFLLESAEQGQQVGRYSFLGFSPRLTLRWGESLVDFSPQVSTVGRL